MTDNSKFDRLFKQIDVLSGNAEVARRDLLHLLEVSDTLKEQLKIQESEAALVQQDKQRSESDLKAVEERVALLLQQKEQAEIKLNELEEQNSALAGFLKV